MTTLAYTMLFLLRLNAASERVLATYLMLLLLYYASKCCDIDFICDGANGLSHNTYYIKRKNHGKRFRRTASVSLTIRTSTDNEDENNNNQIPFLAKPETVTQQPLDGSNIGVQLPISLLHPSSSCNVDQLSGTDLAYIGDVVYELYIRTRTIWPLKRTTDLQQQVVAYVRAEHQSKLLQYLRQKSSSSAMILVSDNIHNRSSTASIFEFTVKEEQVMNRGRNAASKNRGSSSNHRHHPIIYQDSTALEALIGYLYISNTARCMELLYCIDRCIDIV